MALQTALWENTCHRVRHLAFFAGTPQKCAVGRFEPNKRLPDDREWIVARTEVILKAARCTCHKSDVIRVRRDPGSTGRQSGNCPSQFAIGISGRTRNFARGFKFHCQTAICSGFQLINVLPIKNENASMPIALVLLRMIIVRSPSRKRSNTPLTRKWKQAWRGGSTRQVCLLAC